MRLERAALLPGLALDGKNHRQVDHRAILDDLVALPGLTEAKAVAA